MSIIENHWRQEESRWEDGIFLGNDEFIPLIGRAEIGYKIGQRISISLLLQDEPDGLTDLDAWKGCEVQTDSVFIHGGATSTEGAGFIAVEETSTRNLLWLLHLRDSEPFVKITFDGTLIHALSAEYPRYFRWSFPLDTPQLLTVLTVKPIKGY